MMLKETSFHKTDKKLKGSQTTAFHKDDKNHDEFHRGFSCVYL